MAPFDVGDGAGRMSFVLDPTGAAVALWQAGTHIGATRVNEPNTLIWNELTSADLDRALASTPRSSGWMRGRCRWARRST